jgi:alginate O-acetyltransferase complex protein AlgI
MVGLFLCPRFACKFQSVLFNSPLFIIYFLPVFLLAYLLCPSKWKNALALLGSFLFYFWGAPVFALILLVSGTLDFFISKHLNGDHAKQWLWVSVAYNIATLFVFKYFNFFLENVRVVTEGMGLGFPEYMNVALPIGISFFTFQKISYLVDVYRRDSSQANSLIDYLLFVFLFPQLIAGPIVRYKEIADQIKERFIEDGWGNRFDGILRFVLGLSKKVLIADALAPIADGAFSGGDIGMVDAWLGLVAYTLQIYFDFSGYSDMAIGLGKMMGFLFPENFNWPYVAKGFQEFWRRWHITLSNFMRDYLYIPLGGNQGSTSRTITNLWMVFLLSGLWHGASWTFVIWGAWHGLFLSVDRLTNVFKRMPPIGSVGLTFVLVMFGWVWFRADTAAVALDYFANMLGGSSTLEPAFQTTTKQVYLIITAAGFSFIPVRFHSWFTGLVLSKNNWVDLVKLLIAFILVVLCLGQMALSKGQPFIYFRF